MEKSPFKNHQPDHVFYWSRPRLVGKFVHTPLKTHTHRQTEYVYIAVGNMYILATVVDANQGAPLDIPNGTSTEFEFGVQMKFGFA